MTIEDIVALTKAGFSKDEILALTGDPEQEKKPEGEAAGGRRERRVRRG